MDIAEWLQNLGLGRYAPDFAQHKVDWDVLPKLTVADLREIGVTAVGDRRRLLEAIGNLPTSEFATDAVSGEAERRQLTVMFCDLIDSTALATRLDPEDLREVIAAYHRTVTDAVVEFDGFVAKYMGDGVLVYFGYPRAHEDDPERAVRAGLSLVAAVGRLDVSLVKLQVRVGIATGLVVVGDLLGEGSAREQSVVGETPNLAARLQALAGPNAVVIAVGTRQLTGDLFDYHDLGPVEVKGITGPVPAWQVLGPSTVESRFEALRGPALTPLMGRDEEVDLLLRRWGRTKNGDGQVVLVSGEPGFGKSRLTAALEERLQGEPHLRQRLFCSPYRQDSPLYPFIEQIGRAAGLTPSDSAAAKWEKFEILLARGSISDDDAPFLADLLSLPGSERRPIPDLSPQLKKERTLEALLRRLKTLSNRRGVVVIFEDVHWIDPSSRELLDLTIEYVRTLPVLLIVTCRPEFQPSWISESHVTMLVLNRLGRRDTAALVEQIAGDRELPDQLVTQIVERTDGVPLFVEELTKSILESGALREDGDHCVLKGHLPPFAIPTSLHASLLARLDRLGSARNVAQIGATFGRWFRYTSLRAASGISEDELQFSLGQLVAAGLLVRSGAPPDAIYTFKHVLMQEAVYESLLRNTRQQLHGRVAEALEANFPELMDSQPEFFARHYTEAGVVEKSVLYWGKAARRSIARSAMTEAAAQFQRALGQLALLPDSLDHQRKELEFCSALATVLQSVKGYAAPETGQALDRARVLWGQLGSPSEFLQVSYAQSLYHEIRGELSLAHRLDEDLLSLSRQRDDAGGLILAHHSLGRNQMFAGRFTSSRWHFEQALTLCDETFDHSLVRQAGVYPRVASQAFMAISLFCLGYPVQALARSSAAIADARKRSHPPSLAMSLTNGARLASFVGDVALLEEQAEQLATIATERSFGLWRAMGMVYRGWLKAKTGDFVEAISLLRDGLAAYRTTGAEAWVPYQILLLARACEMAGQIEEVENLLDNANAVSHRTGEHWLTAELYRHKGQLLLRQGCPKEAEELYRKALGIAAEQEARLWALRAAMNLARLWDEQGRRLEAHDLLNPVFSWFTEGLETPDLREAATLLAELA
jgi:predicted ATPase/class 3 adenylate cyclase